MTTATTRATPDRSHPLAPRARSKVTTPPFASDPGRPITPRAVSAVTTTAHGAVPTCRPPPGATWNAWACAPRTCSTTCSPCCTTPPAARPTPAPFAWDGRASPSPAGPFLETRTSRPQRTKGPPDPSRPTWSLPRPRIRHSRESGNPYISGTAYPVRIRTPHPPTPRTPTPGNHGPRLPGRSAGGGTGRLRYPLDAGVHATLNLITHEARLAISGRWRHGHRPRKSGNPLQSKIPGFPPSRE